VFQIPLAALLVPRTRSSLSKEHLVPWFVVNFEQACYCHGELVTSATNGGIDFKALDVAQNNGGKASDQNARMLECFGVCNGTFDVYGDANGVRRGA